MAEVVGTVDWAEVANRLAPAREYWVATSAPDGAPHSSPVWGVVLDDDLYFFTERNTVKARNLGANSRVVIHLPSASDVSIVHGSVVDLGRPTANPDVLAEFVAKYAAPGDQEFLPLDDVAMDSVLYRVQPARAMLWDLAAYDSSQRRWSDAGQGTTASGDRRLAVASVPVSRGRASIGSGR
jgi:hypothetical protein